MKIYKEKELQKLLDASGEARRRATQVWFEIAKKYGEEHGDVGCCVLGDGIAVWVLPKGARTNFVRRLIMSPPYVEYQGECVRSAGSKEAMQILKQAGIECFYEHGVMD